jgi:hypothetical protein
VAESARHLKPREECPMDKKAKTPKKPKQIKAKDAKK